MPVFVPCFEFSFFGVPLYGFIYRVDPLVILTLCKDGYGYLKLEKTNSVIEKNLLSDRLLKNPDEKILETLPNFILSLINYRAKTLALSGESYE